MIALLNILPVLVVACGLLLAFRVKKVWIAIVAILFVVGYYQVQPSYMPKGQVPRGSVPVFEQKELPIEDRNSKPAGEENYRKRLSEGVGFDTSKPTEKPL